VSQVSESLAGEGRAAIYSVALEVFEGPLDLLLHLVRRHELDILDIPISFVAVKYLEYLDLMRSLDLEIAGDYLVMAATLAWLKSRELLPSAPSEEQAASEDEEGEDPRAALIRRLVEYERFKSAASELDALPVAGRDVFARGADIDVPPMDPGLAPVTLFRLAEAYYRVLTRAKIARSHDVTIEAVTVAQRMQQLTLMLDEKQEFEFEALFLSRSWSSERELRGMLVVTLMSVLELVKLGVARVQQVPDTTAIRVYRLVASEEARRLVEEYDEQQSFGAPVIDGPPVPSEAELDAIEEQKLLAEALAGLSGEEDEEAEAVVREVEAMVGEEDEAANEAVVEDEAVEEDGAVEEAVLEDRVEEAVREDRVEEAVLEDRVEGGDEVVGDEPVEDASTELEGGQGAERGAAREDDEEGP
jgi:segregation and condensation protein A